MGLSASQARLLSITQRINNNELQSEFISNSKIQLANQNVKASEKYINALGATKLEYISYNQTGIEENVAMTFNALNNYDPLKNQYLLQNTEGQIYVNATDKANFEKSKDLYDFLNKYGLFERGKDEFAEENAAYQADHKAWENERDAYNEYMNDFNAKTTPEWTKYNTDKANWIQNQWDTYYNSAEYIEWEEKDAKYQAAVTAGDPYTIFSGIVGTSDAPKSCYSNALSNPTGSCYKHVLGYLINPTGSKNFTTSAGDTISVGSSDVSGSSLESDGNGQKIANDMGSVINSTYSDGSYIMVCDGDDDFNTDGNQNSLQAIIDGGGTPDKLQILMSDYVYDSATNTATELKSVIQKAVDMMYIIKNQSEFSPTLTADMMKNLLINFTDGDLKNTPTKPTKPPEPDLNYPVPEPQPNKSLRDEPMPPQEELRIYDKPLAQWYTNLWYAMDGQAKSDEITSTYNDQAEFSHFTVSNAAKTSDVTTSNKNYILLEDTKASNSGWLQFALENGMVTISQATKQTNGDIKWLGIEYSSTSDMREVEDSERISLAEAEYEKTVKEIQIEDKKLDQKIKKLDTEHSALEKELESIKGVMDKNTERSFATFS